ncbi:hypothetical protein F5Y15DRAFT_93504 [Xylariaceae sp. FL0016]|nr:hypothetical protein F5Y15DRAFT_93504 [Xylariaceae sp. FL0016]
MAELKQEPNGLSRLQDEIALHCNILSSISKILPTDEAELFQSSDHQTSRARDHKLDQEFIDDSIDEADFENPIIPKDGDLGEIKTRALDRLAEILARFKTDKSKNRPPHKHQDAKHVTAVVMAEDFTRGYLTFFCAKNEGLDDIDLRFLGKLQDILQKVTEDDTAHGRAEYVNQIFDTCLNHIKSRVDYYSDVIQNALKEAESASTGPEVLTNQNMQGISQSIHSIDWEDNHGLRYSIGLGREEQLPFSEADMDYLSDQEDESNISEACKKLQRLFSSGARGVSQSRLKCLLKEIYSIVRNARKRPALKTLLRRLVHNRESSFKKLWSSLLFLTRTFHAAVNFADLASSLGSARLEFRQVPTIRAHKLGSDYQQKPTEALAAIGYVGLNQRWKDYFQDPRRVKVFDQQSRSKRTVHAEVQLIFYIEQLVRNPSAPNIKIFPYMGCSKRCCFFCEMFRIQHKAFNARGTHQTLFPQWALPRMIPQQSLELLHQYLSILRKYVRALLNQPCPPRYSTMQAQSSAALSTAQAVKREPPSYTSRPLSVSLMLGPANATSEHRVEFMPAPSSPGEAYLMGWPRNLGTCVPIGEAETYKINHERSIYMLENVDKMPPIRYAKQKFCRHCRSPARYRCSACWASYCSMACQKHNWVTHVFTCRHSRRPNDVDYLKMALRRLNCQETSPNPENVHNGIAYLLADDNVCRKFGFDGCRDRIEILFLAWIYSTLLIEVCSAISTLQRLLDDGELSSFMKTFCRIKRDVARITDTSEFACVTWFLERQSLEPFSIPNRVETSPYEIWIVATAAVINCFDLGPRFVSGYTLEGPRADVFNLYIVIQPLFRQIPDVHSWLWLRFGFCYCKTFQQRSLLAKKYLMLAESGAAFDDIVHAYETSNLAELMRDRGISTSELEIQGIRFHQPSLCEYSIYRLMICVEHALSGRFCDCFMLHKGCDCHDMHETIFDRESDVTFGFHLTNPWERWQLMNFYRYLFRQPKFDACRMAEATESGDRGSLERYIDSLVPDMRKKICDLREATLLFPRLGNKLGAKTGDGREILHYHLSCKCKEHNVVGPPGVSPFDSEHVLCRHRQRAS